MSLKLGNVDKKTYYKCVATVKMKNLNLQKTRGCNSWAGINSQRLCKRSLGSIRCQNMIQKCLQQKHTGGKASGYIKSVVSGMPVLSLSPPNPKEVGM